MWVARVHIKNLLEEKTKYVRALEIKESKDLMTLFDSLLTTSDPDPRTEYRFREPTPGELHFTFRKMIKIFDFNWTFKLAKANCNPVDLVCR
jgi:hypothetical protein